MRFRQLLSLILIMSILLSIYTTASAAEESEKYEVAAVEVEFSDNVGASEYLTFMQSDGNVYVSASEIAIRFGYQVSVQDDYVLLSKTGGNTNPSEYTILYFDSTEVIHTIFSMEVDGYEAPFPSIKNGEDAWLPFEYTLLLLGGSVSIIDGTFCIDMPETTIIDVFYDAMKNTETYSFDWEDDFGYSNLDVNIIGSSSHLMNLFNGILKLDGDSWVQLFESLVLDSSAYDDKYAEEIALLLCTESDKELAAEVKEIKKYTDLLSENGKIGTMLSKYSAYLDSDVEAWTQACDTIIEEIQNGNSSVAQYNRAYQALEKALNKQTWFSSTGENILEIQKGLNSATAILNAAVTVLEIVGYAEEFQNQDEFSMEALSTVLESMEEDSITSEVMRRSMSDYVDYLKTDMFTYSTKRYFDENLDSWIKSALGISEALGTQANIELLAWSLISSFVPRFSDSLSAADKFELALYAYIYATDANTEFRDAVWSTFFSDNEITAESLYVLSQKCYISLKSWYVTREAAVASLEGKSESVQEQLQPLIDEQDSINGEIAEMLVLLKNADLENENLVYGFLPEDNRDYLEGYDTGDSTGLLTPLGKAAAVDDEQIWQEFLSSGDYLEFTDEWENSYFGTTTGWENKSPEYVIADLNGDGVTELLIQATNDSPFYTTWTFALSGSDIVFVGGVYGYSSFRYSSSLNAVLISPEFKPFDGTGSYPFYQLKNMELVYLFQICQDEGIWYYVDVSGNRRTISDDERESYFADVEYFDWEEMDPIFVDALFALLPENFSLSSGVGNWSDDLNLNADGTFVGRYSDLDMGDCGKGYSSGTIYICDYEGRFSSVQKVDDYRYSVKVEYINMAKEVGNIYYEDEYRYVCVDLCDLNYGDELIVYLPGCPLSDMTEEYVSWWKPILSLSGNTWPDGYYGIYNINKEIGYYGYKVDEEENEENEQLIQDEEPGISLIYQIDLTNYLDSISEMYSVVGGNLSSESGDYDSWYICDDLQYGNYFDSEKVDDIYVSGSEWLLYDIYVGENISTASECLKNSGWKYANNSNDANDTYYFEKDEMHIMIRESDDLITSLSFWRSMG